MQLATLGGGCFWCLEAAYQEVTGVEAVVSGYAGGEASTADYRKVSSGQTRHAEVVQLHFDPAAITYEEILEIFWHIHDPTTVDRQGNDVGPQYRSVIFYHDEEQKAIAERSKAEVAPGIWDEPAVTEICPLSGFWEAEDYHQNYYQGTNRVLTRFGWIKQADAYKRYRAGCGRDRRLQELWGPTAGH